MSSESLFGIRASRASPPPGFAADDDERHLVYGAALAQFDELIAAATAAGPASRPLPLFYTLSQAGRAIAAAHAGNPWRLNGHGLSATELAVPVLDVVVTRKTGKDTRSADSVTGVACATRSEVFAEGATIGELWCSLPEVAPLLPAVDKPRPRPLALVGEETHDPTCRRSCACDSIRPTSMPPS